MIFHPVFSEGQPRLWAQESEHPEESEPSKTNQGYGEDST